MPTDIDTEGVTIYGYNGKFIKVGNGKGIGTFTREILQLEHEQEVSKPTLQISKVQIGGIDSISVYRSSNHSIPDTSQTLKELITVGRPTLITGDFNICTTKNPTNGITTTLMKTGFKKILERSTHIQGGQIDHIYWMDNTKTYNLPRVEFYSPYWTDHDAILSTITKRYFYPIFNFRFELILVIPDTKSKINGIEDEEDKEEDKDDIKQIEDN